ncbi:UvrD-helicase domain-containing protein [Sphingomonas aerolata]|uniref:UvrD-helicase domain-containing protein n=1 Tax=Sphingomonas aerolata TaxID=185951 RepID=UPI002FE1FBA6
MSFARATVSRVLEAIDEEQDVSKVEKRVIEVDTYHSFFWRILKTHGYLVGLPRALSILTPPAEAIALSAIRNDYPAASKLTDAQRAEKVEREEQERSRLAVDEGQVCFDLFAKLVTQLLEGSDRLRRLVSTRYPYIILDEFQDTSAEQWAVVKALGTHSILLALADPEQRIFDFIGADPERLNHFKARFAPAETDLRTDNHRSKGSDIALFGNDILTGKFSQEKYTGVAFCGYQSNANQAYTTLITQTVQARARLVKMKIKDWSLAVLVPTKTMTRTVSGAFRVSYGNIPPIDHSASIDMEGPILAAEIIAYLLEQNEAARHFDMLVDLLCNFYQGRGGNTPGKGHMTEAARLRTAADKWKQCLLAGKTPPKNSIVNAASEVGTATRALMLTGDPDKDWVAVRAVVEANPCPRMRAVADEVRNVRLLERGTQLRQGLAQDWRDNGAYRNALAIVRQSFVREHFSSASKVETGIIVMNMHKAKGKQFDEVIIFEGWPLRKKRQVVANPNRIVRSNVIDQNVSQARQNLRVSVTRAKLRTTIVTPADDICVLLRPA